MTVMQKERPAAQAWAAPPADLETAPDSIPELLSLAKTEIAAGEKSMRKAAEYIAAAQAKGARQTAIARELGKSQSWVNRLLRWHSEGCIGDAFGRSHHRERERAGYYPGNNQDLSDDDQARLKAAKVAARKKDRKFLLDKFIEEWKRRIEAEKRVTELQAENLKLLIANLQSGTSPPAAKAVPPGISLDRDTRDRLVKFLGMMGSSGDGEVVNAARMAEDLRRKLKLTWPDLIVAAKDLI